MFDPARILNEPVTNHIKEKSQILKSMDHIVFGAYEDEVFHLGYLDKACLSATPRVCSRSTNKVFLLFSVFTGCQNAFYVSGWGVENTSNSTAARRSICPQPNRM